MSGRVVNMPMTKIIEAQNDFLIQGVDLIHLILLFQFNSFHAYAWENG